MVLEVGLLGEASVAHVTLVRPRATVYVSVTLQVARGGERLGTQRALVWLLLYDVTLHHCVDVIITSVKLIVQLGFPLSSNCAKTRFVYEVSCYGNQVKRGTPCDESCDGSRGWRRR